MKNILVIIILVFPGFQSYSQSEFYSNLKNNPKSIKTKYIKTHFSEIDIFNEGKLVLHSSSRYGFKRVIEKYQYDKYGNIISVISVNPKSQKDTISILEYKYFRNNQNQIKKIMYNYNNEILKIKDSITYDENENIINYVILYPKSKNSFFYFTEYFYITYNHEGFVKTFMEKSEQGYSQIQYKYNKLGDVIEEITSQEIYNNSKKNEDIIYKCNYEYDKYNNWKVSYGLVHGKPKVEIKRKIKYQ
jgi:hypothetical protein